MFDDPNKELAALQAQLEAQEEWFQRELDSAKRMIGQVPNAPKASEAAPVRNYANNYGAQPVRKAYVPNVPEIQEEEPPKKSLRGLKILASLELLGIFAILGYWAWYFLG